MTQPFYDPNLSYQDNYDLGPFGMFAGEPAEEDKAALEQAGSLIDLGGLRLRRGLGIPAGPLLNSKFTGAAFKWGYDLCHYKTVRSRTWPAHPAPNVLFVDSPHLIPPDKLGRELLVARLFEPGEEVDSERLSITNSFGMPAQPPDVWQADMERAARGAGPGQALVASVYGTPDPEGSHSAYIADFARTAAMAAETGAHAIEVNLSCPNLGGHGLLCHDSEAAEMVCRAVHQAARGLPLFAKIGSFPPDEAGEATLRDVIASTARYLQGYGVVNAVPVPVVSASGDAALPGTGRAMAGVCGYALKATGLDMVRRFHKLRREQGYDYAIVGVGGLASYDDFVAYMEAGADAVQGATGPMWNAKLGVQIATAIQSQVAM